MSRTFPDAVDRAGAFRHFPPEVPSGFPYMKHLLACAVLCLFYFQTQFEVQGSSQFNVIAFYSGKNDLAHISFVQEANQWFPQMAKRYNFTYTATTHWSDLNTNFLSHYQIVMFLDSRPED